MNINKQGERLPRIIPQVLKRRIEVDQYMIYELSDQAAATLTSIDWMLDAGAGQGRFKPDFSHTNYVGVDLAVGDHTWDYGKLDSICDLPNLPFGDNTFHAALCIQVLEHVPEPLSVLKEIARVIKPGGKLYLSVPQSWAQHQKPHDFYRYTSFGLSYLFEKAGLQVESIKPMGGYFIFLAYQLSTINFWLFPKGTKGRWLTWPIRAAIGFIFQLMIPLFLYYLDGLDRQKDETLGYVCVVKKPIDG